MLLNNQVRSFESNVDTSEAHHFGIGSLSKIISIIRDTGYNNKIYSSFREIYSNAIDANKISKTKKKVFIKLLRLSGSTQIIVRDFGPGLTEEEVYSVFSMYGVSTKENKEDQIGGFGIGAKAPFSYSDTFFVESFKDGFKYSFICYLDELNEARTKLIEKSVTSEDNGISVSIPIKDGDYRLFVEAVDFYTYANKSFTQVESYSSVKDLEAGLVPEDSSDSVFFTVEDNDYYSISYQLEDVYNRCILVNNVRYNQESISSQKPDELNYFLSKIDQLYPLFFNFYGQLFNRRIDIKYSSKLKINAFRENFVWEITEREIKRESILTLEDLLFNNTISSYSPQYEKFLNDILLPLLVELIYSLKTDNFSRIKHFTIATVLSILKDKNLEKVRAFFFENLEEISTFLKAQGQDFDSGESEWSKIIKALSSCYYLSSSDRLSNVYFEEDVSVYEFSLDLNRTNSRIFFKKTRIDELNKAYDSALILLSEEEEALFTKYDDFLLNSPFPLPYLPLSQKVAFFLKETNSRGQQLRKLFLCPSRFLKNLQFTQNKSLLFDVKKFGFPLVPSRISVSNTYTIFNKGSFRAQSLRFLSSCIFPKMNIAIKEKAKKKTTSKSKVKDSPERKHALRILKKIENISYENVNFYSYSNDRNIRFDLKRTDIFFVILSDSVKFQGEVPRDLHVFLSPRYVDSLKKTAFIKISQFPSNSIMNQLFEAYASGVIEEKELPKNLIFVKDGEDLLDFSFEIKDEIVRLWSEALPDIECSLGNIFNIYDSYSNNLPNLWNGLKYLEKEASSPKDILLAQRLKKLSKLLRAAFADISINYRYRLLPFINAHCEKSLEDLTSYAKLFEHISSIGSSFMSNHSRLIGSFPFSLYGKEVSEVTELLRKLSFEKIHHLALNLTSRFS